MTYNMFRVVREHPFRIALILLLLGGGGYYGYKRFFISPPAPHYVAASVTKGTLVVSVSGNGQVILADQVDVKPKVSGDIVSLGIRDGQEVKAGAVLARLDRRDAEKAVRDAETNLETARLAMETLKEPVDALTILQAQHSLDQAKESKQKAQESIQKSMEDGFNAITQVFLDLPDMMTGMQDVLFGTALGTAGQWNIDYYTDAIQQLGENVYQQQQSVKTAYQAARDSYARSQLHYQSASRYSENATIEALIGETYETTRLIAESVKQTNQFIQLFQDTLATKNRKIPALATTQRSSLASYLSKTNTHLSSLLSIRRSIDDARQTIVNADRTVAERQGSFEKLQQGPDVLDLRAQTLVIQQRENALTDARDALKYYTMTAPFSGVATKVTARVGDSIGPSSIVTTIITKKKIIELSFNEVDIDRIHVGQKATVTFDAVPDLTVTGSIAYIDSLGVVSQGVVTYKVRIELDTTDDHVKSGMTASASILIEAKPDVLLLPIAAVKTDQNGSYVDRMEAGSPGSRQTVHIGSESESMVEIIDGLTEGDQVLLRTVQPTAQTTAQPQGQSLLGAFGGGGNRGGGAAAAGGNAFRALRSD